MNALTLSACFAIALLAQPAITWPAWAQTTPTAEDVQLRWGYKPGAEWRYRISLEQRTRMEMLDQVTDQMQIQTMELTARVDSVREDGSVVLVWTYDKVRLRVQSPQADVAWSSEDPPADPPAEEWATFEFIREVLGKPITVVLDPRGWILDVVGTDELLEAVLAKAPPEVKPQIERQLRGMLSADQIRTSFMGGLGVFPEPAVAVGASWDARQATSMPGMGRLETTITNTLGALEGEGDTRSAVIRQNGALRLVMDGDPEDSAPEDRDPEARNLGATLEQGALEGETTFSLGRGLISKSRTRLSMAFRVSLSTEPGQTVTMIQRIRSRAKFELLENEEEE